MKPGHIMYVDPFRTTANAGVSSIYEILHYDFYDTVAYSMATANHCHAGIITLTVHHVEPVVQTHTFQRRT